MTGLTDWLLETSRRNHGRRGLSPDESAEPTSSAPVSYRGLKVALERTSKHWLSELEPRTYVLGVVVSVLLGTGIGFGWHYLADRTGGTAAALAAIPTAKQDAPNPPPPNPAAQREGPVPEVPQGSGLSDAQQPARSMALDLSNEEKLALVTLLTSSIAEDRRQSSARVRSLKQILFKLDPKPPAQPFSPPKASAPPDAKRGSARQRG
jgi:hypothetical protein